MANDTDTIRSIMTLVGGGLGFVGAIIAFVNSRLQAASTTDARYKLHTHLFTALEVSLWFGGFIAALPFGSSEVGLWFILFAYIVHCFLFIRGRGQFARGEILALVLATGFVVTQLLLSVISRLINALGH